MDPYMQPGMPQMQPPPPYQGDSTGGPGSNFTDAIAAGNVYAYSLTETMDDIEARLRALNDT